MTCRDPASNQEVLHKGQEVAKDKNWVTSPELGKQQLAQWPHYPGQAQSAVSWPGVSFHWNGMGTGAL